VKMQGIPKDLIHQIFVGMADDVAHSRDFAPWDFGIPLPQIIRQPFCRLADKFHDPLESPEKDGITHDGFQCLAPRERVCLRNGSPPQ